MHLTLLTPSLSQNLSSTIWANHIGIVGSGARRAEVKSKPEYQLVVKELDEALRSVCPGVQARRVFVGLLLSSEFEQSRHRKKVVESLLSFVFLCNTRLMCVCVGKALKASITNFLSVSFCFLLCTHRRATSLSPGALRTIRRTQPRRSPLMSPLQSPSMLHRLSRKPAMTLRACLPLT